MCSNAEHSACGCENGANICSSGLKKQLHKRPRVPKRGPGVAELEKILREQETIGISDMRKLEAFTPHNHHSNNPPSSSNMHMHNHVPSASKCDHLGPTTPPSMTSIYGNFAGHNTLLPRNSGSGLVLPEQELFPMNLTSSKSKFNLNERFDVMQSDSANSSSRNLSYPAMIQKKTNQYPPHMMNQFLGPGNTSSSPSVPTRLHNHVEQPSSQSSHYNSISRLPEQHKIVSMKPPQAPSSENSMIPPSNFQASPMFCQFNRPLQTSTSESQGANFIPFATIGVPPPPMHLFQGELSKGNMTPFQVTQDRMGHAYQHSESRSDHRPFFNFLHVKDDRVNGTNDPNHGGHDASGGIDLSLKL
ncbi:hypothetical protein TanjilG_08052 [Lupinus angustifolius]|uniref:SPOROCYTELESS-like EAR-containing protein n=1 Tax=Lupinus angustifolius TaxID=3871 RepID=A0A4P1RLR1_LUPAN|nr:PREDICTED: uncharacterized protein LOC109345583 [Lupinus angustifolius]OIW13710.1 hypothetical protein TanjilG_08052 [Lupinus angustifolius]